MTSKSFTPIISIASAIVLVISYVLFGNLVISGSYLLGAFSVVLIFMMSYYYAERNLFSLHESKFVKSIFKLSLLLRIFSVTVIYYILYYVMDGDLGIEEYDSIFYVENAKFLNNFYRTGNLDSQFISTFLQYELDDYGYIVILSFKYFISENLLFIKITQTFIDSFSVILFFKILKEFYGLNVAKTGAILYCVFFPFILFSGLHTKEVYMVYFLLLSIHMCIKYVKGIGNNKKTIFILGLSVISIFSMRTVLGLILITSVIGYFIISRSISLRKKVFSILSFSTLLFCTLYLFGVHEQVIGKALAYVGVEYGDSARIGGRSIQDYQVQGQSLVRYASGLVLVPISFISPFPSFVQTNINEGYGMTMQWIFAGGLLQWSYISFFSFIGYFKSIKSGFRDNSLLIFLSTFYIAALIVSFYITSIRFNTPKLLILLMFTAYGLHNQTYRTKYYFCFYIVFVSVLILIWNYGKILGRGLI